MSNVSNTVAVRSGRVIWLIVLALLVAGGIFSYVKFFRGYDVFDRAKVGFVSNVGQADGRSYFLYDTSVPGNSNSGHVYGVSLQDADKQAIVEYLKTF